MKVGILAVQGAFREHAEIMSSLGACCTELRKKEDLKTDYDAIILPGGESTVQGKLLRDFAMLEPLRRQIEEGIPVLATCAGLILLAAQIENDSRTCLGTLPVTVRRNAYGRQLGSFHTVEPFGSMEDIPMTFIRAPYISETSDNVKVLATTGGHIVAVQYKNQLALSFHPELDGDTRIHQMFLSMSQSR